MLRRLLPMPILFAAALGSAQEAKQPDAAPKGDTFSFAFDKSKVFPGRGAT